MFRILVILIIITCLVGTSIHAQRIISSKVAKVQVFGKKADGTDVAAESQKLSITYEPGVMKGEIPVSSLYSADDELMELIKQIEVEKIRFEIFPEQGKFEYGTKLNESFVAESEIVLQKRRTKFMTNFNVSHNKGNAGNVFIIVCNGKLSLFEDFGFDSRPDLYDEISFQFTQNVTVMNK
jgi:hypothetical protein